MLVGLAHNEYEETEAWKRGEATAIKEIASADPTVASVSRAAQAYEDREYYKLCKLCGWDRESDKCICLEDQCQGIR